MGVQSPGRIGPLEWQMCDGSRAFRLYQRSQRRPQDRHLTFLIARLPKQITQRMLDGR